MKSGWIIALAILGGTASLSAQQVGMPPASSKPIRVAVICFKSGEQVSGMNKICYYNCLGSQAAITIGAVQLCPLTIDR